MVGAVAREERDRAAADRAQGHRTGRLAVRRVEGDLLDVFEEGVEAGAAEDADLGVGHQLAAAVLELELLLLSEELELDEELSDDELDDDELSDEDELDEELDFVPRLSVL